MCDPLITRLHGSVTSVVRATRQVNGRRQTYPSHHIIIINVQNFHGSLTTFIRAQNDTTKTANITDTIFDRTLVPLQATVF